MWGYIHFFFLWYDLEKKRHHHLAQVRVHARPARPDMSHEDEGHEFLPCNVVGTSRKRVQECISPCKSARRDDDQTWTSALIPSVQGCVGALLLAALLLCLASDKAPVQDCVLLRGCSAWQAQKGAHFSGAS